MYVRLGARRPRRGGDGEENDDLLRVTHGVEGK